MRYEQPVLDLIGKVTEVILGVYGEGFDLDGSQVPEGAEFALDFALPPPGSWPVL